MKKYSIFFLGLILVLGFILRLYRFNFPIADWHSWRQSDTSSVSRTFVEEGFNLLYPKYMDLSNVPSGKDNPNGYRFVEFPIYNFAQAGLFKLFGVFTLEEWGRIVSIFSSMFAISFVYLILKDRGLRLAGLFAAFFYAVLPYAIYFGRTILPDQSMVAASLGGIYFFQKWLEKSKPGIFSFYFLLSLLFTSISFLLKPYSLFFTLPIIYLSFEKFGISFLKQWKLWLFVIISLVPFVLWRWWMQNFPEGIPASAWLFNEGNIRFKGAFFRWIFAERISKLILGYWGVGLLVAGLVSTIRKKDYFYFLSFIFSSLLYITVMARGNVQHDYYQILIIPSIVIFLGLGVSEFLKHKKNYAPIGVLVTVISFMLVFSWYQVKDFFNINNSSIITAGREIDLLIPKNSKLIASYNGDTSFLYQTHRKGWASMEKSLPEMVQMGAGYLALVNPKKEDYGIGKEYKIIKATNDFILFDLNQKP